MLNSNIIWNIILLITHNIQTFKVTTFKLQRFKKSANGHVIKTKPKESNYRRDKKNNKIRIQRFESQPETFNNLKNNFLILQK